MTTSNRLGPLIDRHRNQRELFFVECRVGVRATRVGERAIETIGPAVVTTHQSGTIAGGSYNLITAMPAYIDETMQLPVFASSDNNGDLTRLTDNHIAALGELLDRREVLPATGKDGFELELVNLRLVVEPERGRELHRGGRPRPHGHRGG